MTTTGAKNEAIMEDRRVRECIGMTFPFKLYGMLEDVEKEGDTCMVSWRHHGNAFTVHEPHVFVEKIMPYYFNQSKYKSFQRQLNLYGFVCIPRGEDKGAYFHKNFVRGERYLCHSIIRRKDQKLIPKSRSAQAAPAETTCTSHKDASLQVRGEQESVSLQQSSIHGSDSVHVSHAILLQKGDLPCGPNQALPSTSLQTRQKEAIALLNRQTKGDLAPSPTPNATPQTVSRYESSQEDVPEDVPHMFNSTEVEPLECPSVTMFDDDENQDNPLFDHTPDHGQRNIGIGESDFQQDEIDSFISLFHDDDEPQKINSDAMVPQYVQFLGMNKNDGDYSFSPGASNDHDNSQNQDLGDFHDASGYSLNANDNFQSSENPNEAPGSNARKQHLHHFFEENNNESAGMINSSTIGNTSALDAAQQETLPCMDTPLAMYFARLLEAKGIHLNSEEMQSLTRISHAEFYEFFAGVESTNTANTAGSRDYSWRKHDYEGEQDERAKNTRILIRSCLRP